MNKHCINSIASNSDHNRVPVDRGSELFVTLSLPFYLPSLPPATVPTSHVGN